MDFSDGLGIAQTALGGIGGIVSGAFSYNQGKKALQQEAQLANENYQHQKEFAQNSIQWRVADAKAAGISPLYALGASGASYTPISRDNFGYEMKSNGISKIATTLDLKTKELQNELLAAQVDAQKLANKASVDDHQTKIETGLMQDKVLGGSLKNPDGSLTVARGQRNADDYAQLYQNTAEEHPLLYAWDTYLNLPDKIKSKYDVDVLKSLNGSVHLVPKGEDTTFWRGIKMFADQVKSAWASSKVEAYLAYIKRGLSPRQAAIMAGFEVK